MSSVESALATRPFAWRREVQFRHRAGIAAIQSATPPFRAHLQIQEWSGIVESSEKCIRKPLVPDATTNQPADRRATYTRGTTRAILLARAYRSRDLTIRRPA